MTPVTPSCRFLAVTVVLVSLALPASRARADVSEAATRGSVGEISNHFITPDGLTLDLMDNDFLGTTDKYMTGSMKAGWTRSFPDTGNGYTSSFEVMGTWRALTPTESGSVGGNPLGRVVGRFADWMEGEIAYARTYDIGLGQRLKGQLTLGGGHIGNKGMRGVHMAVHKAIGMQTSGLDYTNQPIGRTTKYDAMIGDAWRLGSTELLLSIGNARDAATHDTYLQGNVLRPLSRRVSLGLESRLIRQWGSAIYDGLDTWRREFSFALCVFNYYQPSFKYVSPYLPGDDRGQFYAEILRFNVPF